MSGLKKSLGMIDIIALAFGAMVGWGWVVLAGGWVISAGIWGAVLAFLMGVWQLSLLASLMPS
ncbi:hypothetical protein [Psychrobacter piechaudii]|uniref:Uncharacterized protein n=1 Tax=Psychrobacter piechaudii TaxID=1945521 RepID=A0A1R4GPK9_9GAMM|nr:hypothetical protein [Psychrobacter piechaudii]SJM70129.1 hypothetical protein A1232T_00906 [Psychrobacter piechaudii]